MKILYLLVWVVVLASCTKDKKANCWHCSGNVPATGFAGTKDTCTPSGAAPTRITDGNGNDWNFTCTHQ